MNIPITKNPPQAKPLPGQALPFGRLFTDHMLLMNYDRIRAGMTCALSPVQFSAAFGHGVPLRPEVFEGMKAYRWGMRASAVPPMDSLRRFNSSCRRLCIRCRWRRCIRGC